MTKDFKKSILFISRVPFHSFYLYNLLSRYYNVIWVGRRINVKFTVINFFYIILREFWSVLVNLRKNRFKLFLLQFVSLDGIILLFFKRILGSRIVLFAIGSDILKIHEQKFVYPIIRHIILKSDMIICASSLIATTLQKLNVDATKIVLIPPFISFYGYNFYHHPQKKEYDLVTIGSLDENKNQMFLLKACNLLSPSFKTLIIGEGYMRKTLEEESKKNNLTTFFTGQISHKDVFDKLNKSRIYVHTSKSEAGPLVVLEAMFFGLPVITIRSPYAHVLKHTYGFNFHIVDGDSAENLAAKILEVQNNYQNELNSALHNKKIIYQLIAKIPANLKNALDTLI